MAREVRGEGSSSPSANLSLIRATRTGAGGERIQLELSDGSCFFVSEAELREQGFSPVELIPGLELSREAAGRLEESARRRTVREKALSLLARAPHTVRSLKLKLLKRGCEPRAVEEALDWLAVRGYLDDWSFSLQWLESRLQRRPEGRALLVSGLIRRGVARETAEAAVHRLVDAEAERQCARRALDKLGRQSGISRERLMKKLKARGFALPLIRQTLAEWRDDERGNSQA